MKPCVAPLHLYEPGEQSWALFIDPPTSYKFSVATLFTVMRDARANIALREIDAVYIRYRVWVWCLLVNGELSLS